MWSLFVTRGDPEAPAAILLCSEQSRRRAAVAANVGKMASRKEQKEAARQRRLAEEQARREHQRRSRRLQTLGGIIAVAIVVIVVAVVISTSSGGGGSTGLQKGATQSKTVQSVQSLLAGIPQSGAVLGNPGAPITMIYYGDLECPICQDFTLNGGFSQLVANDVRRGKVKVEYRALETATRDPSTFQTQQVAALAAGRQDKFWQFAELFYHEQGQEGTGYVTESYLDGLARQIPGLNFAMWKSARGDGALVSQVQSNEAQGQSGGVTGTPTLIFQGPKGKLQVPEPVPSYSQLQSAIKAVA